MLNIISLGAGVQSSTMALMAACGEITPMPDAAIFADTQNESRVVYKWLDWLESQLPFPVYRVTHGDLRERLDLLPTFTAGGGLGRIFCSNEYKRDVVRRKAHSLSSSVMMWIGISLDECSRMKDSGRKWVTNRFPLIEGHLNRGDCQIWLKRKYGVVAPRSSCVFCPMRTNREWRTVKSDEIDWANAVQVDKQVRLLGNYLHASLKPLDECDFSNDEDRGQLNMFNNECEGMCGL